MSQVTNDIQFYDYHPKPADFYSEVLSGLQSSPKAIAPKFFYDEKGSKLFEQICECEEYYPTRTEQRILRDNADEIAGLIGEHAYVIEPGSGSCEKIKLLLDTLRPRAYIPMDISRDFLQASAQALSDEYPWLDVHAACIDFTQPLDLPFCPADADKLAFFPGSSIGNFEPKQAMAFMQQVANTVGDDGGMLIGVDLKKGHAILDEAYNDKQGITAAFNLNLLSRINQELDADFDLEKFSHRAFYNPEQGRVEMHLVSHAQQIVTIDDDEICFEKGETIHTESSYKYTVSEFQSLAAQAGFKPMQVWTDSDELFSVHFFKTGAR